MHFRLVSIPLVHLTRVVSSLLRWGPPDLLRAIALSRLRCLLALRVLIVAVLAEPRFVDVFVIKLLIVAYTAVRVASPLDLGSAATVVVAIIVVVVVYTVDVSQLWFTVHVCLAMPRVPSEPLSTF